MFQGDRVSVGHRLGAGPLRRSDGGSRQHLRPRVLEPLRRAHRPLRAVRARVRHPVHRFAAQYYRVQQNVRGMIPIHCVTVNAHPRESLAWYLCYRYVGDRATCESLAEAIGVDVERPVVPDDIGTKDVVAAAAVYSLERDVAPKLTDAFATSRAEDAARPGANPRSASPLRRRPRHDRVRRAGTDPRRPPRGTGRGPDRARRADPRPATSMTPPSSPTSPGAPTATSGCTSRRCRSTPSAPGPSSTTDPSPSRRPCPIRTMAR